MSKILFASMAFDGHFNPLTGLAVRLQERGHDVRWYTGPTYAGRLEKLGIPHYPFTRAKDINAFNLSAHFPEYERLAGKKSPKAIAYGVRELFFGQIEPQYRDVCELRANGFDFDAVICDGALFMAHILVEKITPYVYVVMPAPTPAPTTSKPSRDAPPPFFGLQPARSFFGDVRDRIVRRLIAPSMKAGMECLNEFRVRDGMRPYEGNPFDLHARYARALFQVGVPGLEFPRTEWPANFQFVGALLPHKQRATSVLPDHVAEKARRYRRVISVSQGTTDNRDADKLFVPALNAFAGDDDTLVIVTTGGRHTGELRARFPHDNVVVEDWIDFHALLPVTTVFICNGGMGSILLALSYGVPVLSAGKLEGKADINARLASCGAGLDLRTERPTPPQLRRGVARVLAEPKFRERVNALRAEIATYEPLDIIERKLAADGIVTTTQPDAADLS